MVGTSFSLAFRFPFPQPWDFMPVRLAKCGVNIAALYYSIGSVDILTDIVISVARNHCMGCPDFSPSASHHHLCFCQPSCCLHYSTLRLTSIPAFIKSSDRSWGAVAPQLWRQVVQCLSITTACIPYLRPFLASLESGFTDSSMNGVIGRTYGAGSGQGSNRRTGAAYWPSRL